MDDVILETRGLTKEFKGFTAVDDVNLQVQRGHIHALIGPNGAGKTTCFNLLDQVSDADAGRSCSTGATSLPHRPAQIARQGIIRSFQISAVFPHLTVLENVRIGLQRRLGTSYYFWKSEASLTQLNDRAMALLAGRSGRICRYRDGRFALRPQARARNRHHAGDGAGTDAARRTDPGHGARRRQPRHGTDQESLQRPHHPDGRAQHERGVAASATRISVLQRGAILAEGTYAEVSKIPK